MSESTEMEPQAPTTQNDGKIGCAICEARTHSIASHLRESHPMVSIEDYKSQFPDIKLFLITDVAGTWSEVQPRHFADHGIFDKIYGQ